MYDNGLVDVPEPATLSAVVPSVSVNTPLLLTLISFPFASVRVAGPVEEFSGG